MAYCDSLCSHGLSYETTSTAHGDTMDSIPVYCQHVIRVSLATMMFV